jgi:electron transport complex protein RnfE
MKRIAERLYNGIIKENPTFVLTLGMCPTLAVTTSAINGLGMGLTTCAVLALSNLFISILRKVIPDKVRIPAFIVIVASFVTMVQLLLEAYLPSLNQSLGIYIPLIVVNCIILGRAESYAYKNPPLPSLFDGIGMGLGFTFALTILGIFREFIGSGTFFGNRVFPEEYGVTIFVLAPGAFFVLAGLVAIQNYIKAKMEAKGKDTSKIGSGCGMNCMGCPEAKGCSKAGKAAETEDSTEEKTDKPSENVEEKEEKSEAKAEADNEESEEPKEPEQAEDVTENGAENEEASSDEEKSGEEEDSEDKKPDQNKPSNNKKKKGKRRK